MTIVRVAMLSLLLMLCAPKRDASAQEAGTWVHRYTVGMMTSPDQSRGALQFAAFLNTKTGELRVCQWNKCVTRQAIQPAATAAGRFALSQREGQTDIAANQDVRLLIFDSVDPRLIACGIRAVKGEITEIPTCEPLNP